MTITKDEQVEIVADISSRILVDLAAGFVDSNTSLDYAIEAYPNIAISFAHAYVEHMKTYVDQINNSGAH